MIMNMAIDSGYGYLMGKSCYDEVKIPSYIVKIPEVEVKDIKAKIEKVDKDNILVRYKDKYYIIGKLATKVYPDAKRSLSNQRINNDEHLIGILTLATFLYQNNNSIEINLGVGLPEKLIERADDYEAWLKNKFEFSFITNSKEIKKTVSIKETICMNQGLAPIYLLDENDLSKKIISIDIGHNTFHAVYWNDGQAPTGLRVDGKGMKTCYDEMKTTLRKNMDNLIDVYQYEIERIIETGIFVRNKKNINISDYLDKVFENKAEEIYSEIEGKYGEIMRTVDIIMANGGAMQNEKFIEKLGEKFTDFYDVEFSTFNESQWSVSRGIYKYISEVLKDDFNDFDTFEEENDSNVKGDDIVE